MLLDPSDRVLLLRGRRPVRPGQGGLVGAARRRNGRPRAERAWPRPGSCTRRPGIVGVDMGPCVWRHHATFEFAGYYFDQHEYIHVARSRPGRRVEYRPAGLEALEAMAFRGARWWPLDELARPRGGRRPGHPALAGRAAAGVAGRRVARRAHRHGRARRRVLSEILGVGGFRGRSCGPDRRSRLGPECVPALVRSPNAPSAPRSTSGGRLLGAKSISRCGFVPYRARKMRRKATMAPRRRPTSPGGPLRAGRPARGGGRRAYSSRLGAPPARQPQPGSRGSAGWRPPGGAGVFDVGGQDRQGGLHGDRLGCPGRPRRPRRGR